MDRAIRHSRLQSLFHRRRSGYRVADLPRLRGTGKRTIERDQLELQGRSAWTALLLHLVGVALCYL